MANARFANEVRAQTEEAIAAGATPLIDKQWFPEDDGGTYLMPQVLVGVDHSMRVMMEESFGPVVGIMKVKNDEEAIALMNDSPYGLTVSLWTNPIPNARRGSDRRHRDRHGVHEPRRLSRSGPVLDRLQGYRTRRHARRHRFSQSHPPQILPSETQGLNA